MADVTRIIIPYAPRRAFIDFHNRTQRWACLVAHRRAGKTVACVNDLIRHAFTDGKADGRYAYIAPFYSQAKSIAWDYLLRYTKDVAVNTNASELWVELINGARIRLFGADNPDALRGLYLDGVILDEGADMRPRVWGEIIRPLLADREGWAVFIGTPRGHNFFYSIWKMANTGKLWFSASIKASESGILSKDELEDAARGMTQDQYEQEFECSFDAAILGAYYGTEIKALENEGRITDVQYDINSPVFTAWDLGYHDDTAIWFWQMHLSEVHIIDFYSGSGLSIDAYAKAIKSRQYNYKTHYLPHDARAKTLASGGKSIIEQLGAHLSIDKMEIVPSMSMQDGIQAARVMLRRTSFDRDNCYDAVELLKQYQRQWDADRKTFMDRPRHDFTSHAADAFRMMAIAWKEYAPKVEEKKPIFPIVGTNSSMIQTEPLNTLWNDRPRRSNRL